MNTVLIGRDDPERGNVEQFIRARYAAEYGARIKAFPDRLAGWCDADGTLRAACGFRTAEDGFFSETYLDCPAEMAISRAFRRPVDRDRVLEVTTLASGQAYGALALLHAVIGEARLRGVDFGLFTGTARLRDILAARGMAPREVARARPERVVDPANWGSYYANDPRVCALHDAREAPLIPYPPARVGNTQPAALRGAAGDG